MSEAQLRGINLAELKKEAPSHPTQIRARRQHEEAAAQYWGYKRIREQETEPKGVSCRKYDFTPEQLRIVDEIVSRKKADRGN